MMQNNIPLPCYIIPTLPMIDLLVVLYPGVMSIPASQVEVEASQESGPLIFFQIEFN